MAGRADGSHLTTLVTVVQITELVCTPESHDTEHAHHTPVVHVGNTQPVELVDKGRMLGGHKEDSTARRGT